MASATGDAHGPMPRLRLGTACDASRMLQYHQPGELPCSAVVAISESACDQQRTPYLKPTPFREMSQDRTYSIPSCQRDMVEIQSASRGHAVVLGEDNFGCQSTNRAGRWRDDDFIETVDYQVAG